MLSPIFAHRPVRLKASRRLPRVAVFLLISLSALHGLASEAPLTLAHAQSLALERSRQLTAKNHAISASRDMAVAAGQLPDPVLNVGIDNLPVNGSDRFSLANDAMTMRRIGVMQEFTRADKRRLRSDRFEREAEKSLAEKQMAIAAIERETALAWFDRYYAEASVAILTEQAAQTRLEIQAAEGAYRAGRASQADVIAARSALAEFDNRTSLIQRRLRNAKTMLARWIGAAAQRPLAGKPDIDTLRLQASGLESELAHHPQIAVLTKQQEIAAIQAQLAKAEKKPDWSVELMYSQRGPAYDNMVSVGVSVPLQWNRKNRQDRELSARLAIAEQARAERDEALLAHIAETRTMINEWQDLRERHARYQRELIPLAHQRTAAAIAAYRGGKASLDHVLAARRNEIELRLQSLELESEAARLWAQLNFLFPTNDGAGHPTVVTTGATQ